MLTINTQKSKKKHIISFWFFLCTLLSKNVSSQIVESINQQNIPLQVLEDTCVVQRKHESFKHQLNIEYRPASFIPSEPFYKVDQFPWLKTGFTQSAHLKYSFSFPENSLGHRIFPKTQQGLGIAIFDFGNAKELGTPFTMYLFQRSQIARISNRISLDYEWDFGVSTGWVPYHSKKNPNNIIVGSKTNAYINLGTLLRWQLSENLALNTGIDFTHFSNGNTDYPNAGVNLYGAKLGMTYDFSGSTLEERKENNGVSTPIYPKHLNYDLVIFGSVRRKGVDFFGTQVPSPLKYPVLGAYFAPMYNWGYRFRTGLSLDALYDGSANVYTEDFIIGTQQEFFKPEWTKQIALGLSTRIDYVMPIFTIGVGVGKNVLYKGADFKGTYQAFSLKIRATRSSFVHIGYNLKDFQEPNYLMLGIGYRFNNQAPSLLVR